MQRRGFRSGWKDVEHDCNERSPGRSLFPTVRQGPQCTVVDVVCLYVIDCLHKSLHARNTAFQRRASRGQPFHFVHRADVLTVGIRHTQDLVGRICVSKEVKTRNNFKGESKCSIGGVGVENSFQHFALWALPRKHNGWCELCVKHAVLERPITRRRSRNMAPLTLLADSTNSS